MNHVKMIQTMTCNWHIESQYGHVLVKNITCGTVIEAEEYVKRYISSFDGWSYSVIPLTAKSSQ